MEESMEKCGGVLVPDPVSGAHRRVCFVQELGEHPSGRPFTKLELRWSVDHYIPTSLGGFDEMENLHVVHRYCNDVQGGLLTNALFTPDQRRENARVASLAALVAKTPEQMSDIGRKGYAGGGLTQATSEQRSEWSQIANASQTNETRQRAWRTRKANGFTGGGFTFTPEQLSENGRKGALRRNELHGPPGTHEASVKGGRTAQARMTSEERQRRAHVRYHVNRGIVNPSCQHCIS